MRPHVVRQGESLATIAVGLGVDPETVWNEAENAALRATRSDPHVLAPGDVLYVPEPQRKWLKVQIGAKNRFVATLPMLHAKLRCVDEDGTPLAAKTFVVDGSSPPFSGVSDGNGVVDLQIPAGTAMVRIRFPELEIDVIAQIAHLDPVTQPSGANQRLAALGLLPLIPPVADFEASQVVEMEYREAALREFQKARGLAQTGTLDDATQNALVDAHGA